MGREGRTSEPDNSVGLDTVYDEPVVRRNLRDKGIRKIYAISPLISFHGNLDMGHLVSGKIRTRTYGLDGTRYGRMHVC